MARKAREKSVIGIYMVQLKATEDVLFDYKDRINFLNIIKNNKINLLSYTLLNNSFFFVIKEDGKALDAIMRKLTINFAKSYNKNLNRVGSIFAGRFVSFPAQSENDTIMLIANVHSAARFSEDVLTSCNDYFEDEFIDKRFATKLFPNKADFYNICNGVNIDGKKIKMTDDEVANYISNTFQIQPHKLSQMPKSLIEKIVGQVFKVTKASVRQVARVSKLSLRMLWDFAKKLKPSKKDKSKDVVSTDGKR